jgi:hypothetical protein
MRRKKAGQELAKDVFFILIGIAIAIVLANSGAIDMLVDLLGGQAIASFAAGIFFTSAFTLAPATIALAHISAQTPILEVALWGGLGAMCGDLALFLFIRDRFGDDIKAVFKSSFLSKHFLNSFHVGFMKWLSPLVGAVIIASPLPDEFGLGLMGLSKTRLYVLMPISFVMNVIGIYIVAQFAQLL